MAFLASAVSVLAAQGPAESAVEFVKKLGNGKVDLTPETDTAIVSEISPNKKESILQRLQRLTVELNGGKIEIGPTRIDGTLAGVIVRMVDPADPMSVRVLPLAMVRNGETWRAAPVPASFENTIAAYSRSSRDIAQQLELWLAREQASEIERIRSTAEGLLRESLAKSVSPEILRTWTAEKAISEFQNACEKRDISLILALLGGLSDPLPDGWQQLSATARAAVSTAGTGPDTWSLLTSPAVLRTTGFTKNAEGEISLFHILFLDPRKDEAASMLGQTLTIHRGGDGLWKIEIPASAPSSVSEEEFLKKSATQLPSTYPARPKSSAEELKKSLIDAFQSPDLPHTCLEFIHRENNPAADLKRYKQAVVTRWETMDPAKPVVPFELGFQQESEHAYLALQWLSLSKLAYEPRVFYLQKNPDGWVWNASPDMTIRTDAEKWLKQNEAAWKKTFLEKAVQSCALANLADPAPEAAEATALVKDWLDALSRSHWQKALSFCGHLGAPKSSTDLLRNLGYECKSVPLARKSPFIDVVGRGASVTLVSARSGDDSAAFHTLLPVVSTPTGPRILMEIDLGPPNRPGRAFLNRNALDRLNAVHPKAADELRDMLSKLKDGVAK